MGKECHGSLEHCLSTLTLTIIGVNWRLVLVRLLVIKGNRSAPSPGCYVQFAVCTGVSEEMSFVLDKTRAGTKGVKHRSA